MVSSALYGSWRLSCSYVFSDKASSILSNCGIFLGVLMLWNSLYSLSTVGRSVRIFTSYYFLALTQPIFRNDFFNYLLSSHVVPIVFSLSQNRCTNLTQINNQNYRKSTYGVLGFWGFGVGDNILVL